MSVDQVRYLFILKSISGSHFNNLDFPGQLTNRLKNEIRSHNNFKNRFDL